MLLRKITSLIILSLRLMKMKTLQWIETEAKIQD